MRGLRLLGCVLVLGIAWAQGGCSKGGDAERAPAKETATPAPAVTPAPDTTAAATPAVEVPSAATETPEETPSEAVPAKTAETPATTPAPETTPAEAPGTPATPAADAQPAEQPAAEQPAPEQPAPEPAPAASDLDGQVVAVPATKEGLTYVGAAKCKICHKIQFASWEQSAHAKRTPPLDCEGCHGPGSEYKTLKIMKDPEAAKAAGLVIPTKAFCVQCHRDNWKDTMLARAHAHKGDAP